MDSAGNKPRILVVEDEPISALFIKRQLLDLGYDHIGQSALGEESVDLVGTLKPNLVLMDIQLAGAMDGIAAAVAIRNQFAVPVIFITATADEDVLARAKLAEPFGFIVKPCAKQELRTVLEMALYKHQAETKLRESALHTQAILDNMVDGLITINATGVIESFNKAANRIFGYGQEEIVGQNVSILMSPQDLAEHDAALLSYSSSGKAYVLGRSREVIGVRKNKEHFPMSLSVSESIRGGQTTFIGVVRDLTEQHAAQNQLRKLSQAVAQSPEMIVITDTLGRIEYVNESFIHNNGYALNEVIGQNPKLLQSGNTPAETYISLWESLRDGKTWQGQFHNRRKDGSEYISFAIIAPLRQPDGSISHYVAVNEDITERKRLGEELDRHRHHLEEMVVQRTTELIAARQQADAANLAKSEFLANMSHEIRTPMNAILGFSNLLRRESPTAQQIERLNKINSAGQHLLSIISDVLDISKIEAGRLELEDTEFSIQALVDSVATIITPSAREKGLSVHTTSIDLPPTVRGDPTRLRQALLNYAGNAVKFTERGQVNLAARLVDAQDGNLVVRFDVSDTGIGIQSHDVTRLFQAFEQADASTTRKYGGTGLGLAITHRLAHLMGGDAGVQSEFGVGSTFWFTAHLRQIQGHSTPATTDAQEDAELLLQCKFPSARILVVDDDPFNREIAADYLKEISFAVDTAANGKDAVAQVIQSHYDLILMDVQMPIMNGLEATKHIRQLPGKEHTPILALSANVFVEDRRACIDAGMNDFVSKPVDPGELYSALLKWLSSPVFPIL
ncbi:response regulator [Rhodoferax aquaticus]|uniref:Sensor protein FixL n=1 Tax=Rhodoferax aquaticus TaxID=2527691 RepID=A0A515ENL0_9BURK|nr:response regulator [Rhodoferax aquaticus]QDL54257.1 response regulator [Rhodoferax aquaticus]